MISIPIAAALFAYAGFTYATAGGGEAVSKAHGIFKTAGLGFLIALSGWLVINTILNVLLAGGPYAGGNWFSIQCVARVTASDTALSDAIKQLNTLAQAGGGTGGPAAGGSNVTPSTVGTGTCAPGNLSSTFGSNAQAMSCIATGESSCDPLLGSNVDRTSDGAPFSVGLYQINLTQNNTAGNLNSAACTALNGGQPLNCSQAFNGTNSKATIVNTDLYSKCLVAAQNVQCNAASAQYLLNGSGGYNNWKNVATQCGLVH